MAQLGPWLTAMGGFGGGAAPAAGGAAPAGEAKKAAEEAPKEAEKTHFDLELTSFEAADKIKVIKEIRALLGLGLKESKEMVEGAPVWIKKEVKKEEADQIVEKLKAVGAVIRLA
jgi:large subunit ribosomal protein L7/L12